MSDRLWLQLPRARVVERGFGVTHVPAEVRGRLGGGFAIDPLCGYATARVVATMEGAVSWETAGEGWVPVTPFVLPDRTYAPGVAHRATGEFRARTEPLPAGQGWFFGFIPYGGGFAFNLTFGSYRLRLDGGEVSWSAAEREVARARLWHQEEWEGRLHTLYVYGIGDRLAARRMGQSVATEVDTGLLIETASPAASASEDTHPDLPADEASESAHVRLRLNQQANALPAGPVTVTGRGYLAFGLAPERHETGLVVRHETIVLPEEATEEPWLEAAGIVPAGAVLEARMVGPDGAVWEAVPDPPYTGCGYQVEATLPGPVGPNVYLTRVRLGWPEKVTSDDAPPVDLAEFSPAGIGGTGVVRAVELRRGPDPESCGLSFELLTVPGEVAPYLQPHMKGRWEPDGSPWLTFYTSTPTVAGDGPQETLWVECESTWKLFKLTRWAGDGSYAGKTLGAAYREVAQKAGLAADEIVVVREGATLPDESPDGEALFDFQPGQTLDQILGYLREQFDAAGRLCLKADGKLYVEAKPEEASGVVFAWAHPALGERGALEAIARGSDSVPLIREWSETFDESGLVNDVWVVGQRRDGQPVVAVATDWESVRERLARNYVAGFRRMTIVDGGLTSQGLVNWVARTVLERLRRPRLTARMSGTAVAGLYEQDIVEIAGRGLWRVISLAVTWSGEAVPRSGAGSYELEYLRASEPSESG